MTDIHVPTRRPAVSMAPAIPKAVPQTSKVCVGLATRGRPGVLAAVVDHLKLQTLRPTTILIACAAPEDVGDLAHDPDVTILIGKPGLARQRNNILRQVPNGTDVVVFFDDDFVAHPDWIAGAVAAFAAHPRVACVTGRVVADGINGPGITFPDACAALAADDGATQLYMEGYSPYGCNMAFRCAALGALSFDESLVLYGWLEDRDFGGALAQTGWHLVKIGSSRGVHMGVKTGRVSGRKLGYSQIMNPVYLWRKGTMTLSAVLNHTLRNLAANLAGSVSPEPFIDRRGRLHGNVIAVLDLLRGSLTPERAEHI